MRNTENTESAAIELSHGAGGRATGRLVREIFLKHLGNPELARLNDGAIVALSGELAFSTDAFVVEPLEFPGGDIGKLAVCGTVNDVAMCGAVPRFLSAAFILEEGLPLSLLERLVASMAAQARTAGVAVVTGDTKVVPRGRGDGVYIATSGVGVRLPGVEVSCERASPSDRILVSGPVGDHGATIMAVRAGIDLTGSLHSDCASVAQLTLALLTRFHQIHCLRDPTRGGLAAVLNEFATASKVGIWVDERSVPIAPDTRAACELLGLDPLHLACEGRFVAVLPKEMAREALSLLRSLPGGESAADIGEVRPTPPGQVVLTTSIGGTRLLDQPEGEPIPRIC
jgi:hydrogenase expression/formation protein HypE